MPIFGKQEEQETKMMGQGFKSTSYDGLASSFKDTVDNVLNESGFDIFREADKVMLVKGSNETMKNYFIENSADQASMTAEEYDDHIEMMEQQYKNDRKAVLEYASMGGFNPVIGMTFPLHKNVLMNCIFDKGAIPKAVTASPKFTITMENRYLVTPEGKDIDLYRNQMEITPAYEATNPFVDIELKLPETGTTDILNKMNISPLDNLSIETFIAEVKMGLKTPIKKDELLPTGEKATADVNEAWFPVRLQFKPGYGSSKDRSLMEVIEIHDVHVDSAKCDDTISACMRDNKFQIMSLKGNVKAVKLRAKKDPSNAMLQTCSCRWDTDTVIEEVPNGTPINCPISPEEIKDLAALYQVNQLSKIMEMFNLVLANIKDNQIKNKLDDSYRTMPKSQKAYGVFDFAPREGYLLDQIEWRNKTFMDYLDTQVTEMLNVLNDPNMVITVFGRPDLIRKVAPTEYSYQSPSSIGPVELEFTRTVVTSDKRTYQFISSQKLNDTNELIIILCPRNTNRIMYRIYDYQMYVSNEIRNAQNPALPAVHAFQRWKFVEYQPVQGRIRILNPTGYREGKDLQTLGTVGKVGYGNNMLTKEQLTTPTTPKDQH